MVNVRQFLVAKPELKNFENSHFIASVWRLHYLGDNDKKIKSLLSLFKILLVTVLNPRKRNLRFKQKQLFVFARYDGGTSSGILEPILHRLNSLSIISLGVEFKALESSSISHIGVSELFKTQSLHHYIISLREAISLCLKFSRITKTKFNFSLCHEYFVGIFIYQGLSPQIKPGNTLLVETDATSVTRALVQSFNSKDCHTICIQHGTMGWHQFPMKVKSYFVWGKYFEQEFNRYQCQDNGVSVKAMGYPRLEVISERLNIVGEPTEEFDLLVISNTHGRSYDDLKPDFFRCLDILVKDGVKVLVKLHPAETKKEYVKYLSAEILNKIVFEQTQRSLIECLRVSSMVYLIDSAAVMEVLLFNKSLLFLEGSLCTYPEHGGGVWVNPKNIKMIFSQIKNGTLESYILNSQKDFFNFMISNFSVGSKTIAEEIERLLEL